TSFTMDPALSEAVLDTFIHLHKKGLIYRGIRMVNWDPKGKTAVSDEEVIRKEVSQKLYYIKYKVAGSELKVEGNNVESYELNVAGHTTSNLQPATQTSQPTTHIVIATTRPETIMADAAICINPNDDRYKFLKGRSVFIP